MQEASVARAERSTSQAGAIGSTNVGTGMLMASITELDWVATAGLCSRSGVVASAAAGQMARPPVAHMQQSL